MHMWHGRRHDRVDRALDPIVPACVEGPLGYIYNAVIRCHC